MKSLSRKKGFTLIEVLLVVGFIALASLGVYITYNKVQTGNAANTESRNLDTIRAGVKNLFGASSSYEGLTNSVLNNARVTPENMRAIPYIAGDDKINNSFGGGVTVEPVKLGTGADNNGFSITYNNVPSTVCSKLATSGGTGFDQVTIGTTAVKKFGTGNLEVDALATACAADNGSGVTIVFDSL